MQTPASGREGPSRSHFSLAPHPSFSALPLLRVVPAPSPESRPRAPLAPPIPDGLPVSAPRAHQRSPDPPGSPVGRRRSPWGLGLSRLRGRAPRTTCRRAPHAPAAAHTCGSASPLVTDGRAGGAGPRASEPARPQPPRVFTRTRIPRGEPLPSPFAARVLPPAGASWAPGRLNFCPAPGGSYRYFVVVGLEMWAACQSGNLCFSGWCRCPKPARPHVQRLWTDIKIGLVTIAAAFLRILENN